MRFGKHQKTSKIIVFFFAAVFGFFIAPGMFAVSDPVLIQNYYRWYANKPDSVDVTDPWPEGSANLGENTPITQRDNPPGSEDILRLRISVRVISGRLDEGAQSFKLQYAEMAGASCGGGDETWVDLGAEGSDNAAFRTYFDNTPEDGLPLQNILLSVSDSAENYEEDGVSAENPDGIAEQQDGEWDWVVQTVNVEPATEYCFRMVKNDDSDAPLAGYNNYPKLITSSAAGKQKSQIAPQRTRRVLNKEIKIDKNAKHSCEVKGGPIDISGRERTSVKLEFTGARRILEHLEIGSLPFGIDITFSSNGKYTYQLLKNKNSVVLEVVNQPDSQRGNFSIPVIYQSMGSATICQVNIINFPQ